MPNILTAHKLKAQMLTLFFVFVRIAYVEFYTPESVLMALAMSGS